MSVITNKKKLFIIKIIIQQAKKSISLKMPQTCNPKIRLNQYWRYLTKMAWNVSIKFIE